MSEDGPVPVRGKAIGDELAVGFSIRSNPTYKKEQTDEQKEASSYPRRVEQLHHEEESRKESQRGREDRVGQSLMSSLVIRRSFRRLGLKTESRGLVAKTFSLEPE